MATTGDTQWLSQVVEEALEPDLSIIDPHHHLWDYPESRYVASDFLQDTATGHNVVQSVFVECKSKYRSNGPQGLRPVGETEYVCRLADESDTDFPDRTRVATGIVGYADLSLGAAVDEVLSAHIDAGRGRFRGIRHACAWDASDEVRNSHTNPPEGLLLREDFRKGFALLEKHGLSFDAWHYHTQIPQLIDLARAFPDTTIILDHLGGPVGIGPYAGKRSEIFDDWKSAIVELAQYQNVTVKLGGLAMKICGFGWHNRDKPPTSDELACATAPYYHFCIEQFGPERCMFESNFPMDRLSASYGILWNAFKKIANNYSATERAAMFHDTAARIYRLAANP
ncbi:MAG: amidohydrolase family protein [Burkholderiales bacterium]|nr:amidohydrolase family protein [Burkholderiales bacterium]